MYKRGEDITSLSFFLRPPWSSIWVFWLPWKGRPGITREELKPRMGTDKSTGVSLLKCQLMTVKDTTTIQNLELLHLSTQFDYHNQLATFALRS